MDRERLRVRVDQETYRRFRAIIRNAEEAGEKITEQKTMESGLKWWITENEQRWAEAARKAKAAAAAAAATGPKRKPA